MPHFPTGVTIRHEPKPGDIGCLIYLHGVLYAEEYGFNCRFEAGMAGSLATFATNLSHCDRFWLVHTQKALADSLAIEEKSTHEAELRWLLLHPKLRGNGIGRFLVQEALQFCHEQKYSKVFLWTIKRLKAAKELYQSVGFEMTNENTQHCWGQTVTIQRYELELG